MIFCPAALAASHAMKTRHRGLLGHPEARLLQQVFQGLERFGIFAFP